MWSVECGVGSWCTAMVDADQQQGSHSKAQFLNKEPLRGGVKKNTWEAGHVGIRSKM